MWAEDGRSCKAEVTDVNGNTEVYDVQVTSEVKEPATCKEKGTTVYTAVYGDSSESVERQEVTPTTKSYKAKDLQKKAQTITLKIGKCQGSLSFTSSNKKYVTVTSKGKITIKKGTKKGKYKVTVTAKGNKNYKAVTKTVTIAVK